MSNALFYKRHGAQATLEQQWNRANYGLTPEQQIEIAKKGLSLEDEKKDFHPDSTRFISHQAQLNAVQRAEHLYKIRYEPLNKTGFTFDMDDIVGEGYKSDTSNPVQTTKVRAAFRNGKLYTLFPYIKE